MDTLGILATALHTPVCSSATYSLPTCRSIIVTLAHPSLIPIISLDAKCKASLCFVQAAVHTITNEGETAQHQLLPATVTLYTYLLPYQNLVVHHELFLIRWQMVWLLYESVCTCSIHRWALEVYTSVATVHVVDMLCKHLWNMCTQLGIIVANCIYLRSSLIEFSLQSRCWTIWGASHHEPHSSVQ